MAKQRILMVTSTFPLREGDGNPRFVFDLARAVSEHADVTVLAPDAPGVKRREQMGPLEVLRFTYFWPRRLQKLAYGAGMPYNLRHSGWAILQIIPFIASEVMAIRRCCRDLGIRAVNAHWLVPQGLAGALARSRRVDFRLVTHVHSSDLHLLRRLPGGRTIARFVVRRSSVVFATSTYVRDRLDELLGWESGSVLQPMGVDVAAFANSEADIERANDQSLGNADFGNYLLFVGRLVPIKGVEYLIRAVSLVRKAHPDVGLLVVGSGPQEAELSAQASRAGLEGVVHFMGHRPHTEVARYLRSCCAFVLPSIAKPNGETEGMPTVILEAMASGARVVASAVGGVPDIVVHNENGWLCREGDAADLAEKICLALEAHVGSVERKAQETARAYDWEVIGERCASLMRDE